MPVFAIVNSNLVKRYFIRTVEIVEIKIKPVYLKGKKVYQNERKVKFHKVSLRRSEET